MWHGGSISAVLLLVLFWCLSLGRKSGDIAQDKPIEIRHTLNLLKQLTIEHLYVPFYPGTLDNGDSPRTV